MAWSPRLDKEEQQSTITIPPSSSWLGIQSHQSPHTPSSMAVLTGRTALQTVGSNKTSLLYMFLVRYLMTATQSQYNPVPLSVSVTILPWSKQSYLPWLVVLQWLNFISIILGILNPARSLQFRPNELSPNFRQREESYPLNMDCLFIDTYGQQLEEILVTSNPLPTVRKEVIPNQLQSFTWSMSHSEHILGHIYYE